MDLFNIIYYPNSQCHPLTLARSILVFDEITFFDHPSLTFQGMGTVGHDSLMRTAVEPLRREGYTIRVVKTPDGPVEGELEKLVDADLENHEFRKVFFTLIRNDPSFLIEMVPPGQYGKNTAETLRQNILDTHPADVPHRVSEMRNVDFSNGIPENILIALRMAEDSHLLNMSVFFAINNGLQLFGDSKGMDMLLRSKFSKPSNGNTSISHLIAFKLIENIIPNEAFRHKKLIDIVRFRNETVRERNKFKERVLEASIALQRLSYNDQKKLIDKIVYKELLPEARNFQNAMADNWDKFFKDSTKSLIKNSHQIVQIVATILPTSLPAALLAGASQIGVSTLPYLIDYLKEKEKIERKNPYSYLMKF